MSVEPINVALQRARTPGCATGHHLNAAGAALQSSITLETVLEYLRVEAFTGGYEAARKASERVEQTYTAIAALTGAAADEVAIVDSATRAWQNVVAALRLGRGDRVIVTRTEYVSNALMLLALQRERGIVIDVIDPRGDGTVDLVQLEAALNAGPTAMVAVGHIPTFSALVEPVAEVGALSRHFGVPFVLDATQTLGQLPVDVATIGCDALVSTGRKFLRGPRGTGILIVRRPLLDRLEPVTPDVRGATWTGDREFELKDSARRFETFEHSPALRLGLGVAIEQVLALGIDAIAARIGELADELRGHLAGTPGVTLADPPARAGGIVTFTVDGAEPAAVVQHLADHRVHVVSVPASHGRWELDRRELHAVVRASVHIYNDSSDFDALVEALAAMPVRAQARA